MSNAQCCIGQPIKQHYVERLAMRREKRIAEEKVAEEEAKKQKTQQLQQAESQRQTELQRQEESYPLRLVAAYLQMHFGDDFNPGEWRDHTIMSKPRWFRGFLFICAFMTYSLIIFAKPCFVCCFPNFNLRTMRDTVALFL